jgi:hypothetical protein
MVLLHTHEIQLRPGVVVNGDQSLTVFPSLTQRAAAAVIASLWAELEAGQDGRSDYTYWYHQYNSRARYELLSDVPEALRPRLFELRDVLARDRRVASLVAED